MPLPPYRGSFDCFDFGMVKTCSIRDCRYKVCAKDMLDPASLMAESGPRFSSPELDAVVEAILRARSNGRAVMVFTGAHLVKNGFGLLLVDLMRRGIVTLVGSNAAGFIHDVEFALVGETSEMVPDALPKGRFGTCDETPSLMNMSFRYAIRNGMGAGEALGRLILGEPAPSIVRFSRPDLSIAAAGVRHDVPVTMHASIGTDVIDQHPSFDPEAKGGASGIDFGVFVQHARGLEGGVMLNLGSSVQGPEVFLKAVNLVANVGMPPLGVTAASFDIRPANLADPADERAFGYYFRDQKSIVCRIPEAFGGKGYYVEGDHLLTIPALYRGLVSPSSGTS